MGDSPLGQNSYHVYGMNVWRCNKITDDLRTCVQEFSWSCVWLITLWKSKPLAGVEVGEVWTILENIVKSYKIIKKRKRNYQKSVIALDLVGGITFQKRFWANHSHYIYVYILCY